MSCSGCRVLRKGCSETCVLRSCLHWIASPQAQGNATLFLAKFFGRSDLMSFISAVPESQRPALFQSLLFEACGRTVNPVNGAVGLLWSGNWHVCQVAVETVLSGGSLRPLAGMPPGVSTPSHDESSDCFSAEQARRLRNMMTWPQSSSFVNMNQTSSDLDMLPTPKLAGSRVKRGRGNHAVFFITQDSSETATVESNGGDKNKLLNLFV